jgi:hypothetical protein
MRADPDGEVQAIATAIEAHLDRHPLAADSAAGVARWWLGDAHAGVTVEKVRRALNLLVARQAMRRLKLMDGTCLYSLRPATRQ